MNIHLANTFIKTAHHLFMRIRNNLTCNSYHIGKALAYGVASFFMAGSYTYVLDAFRGTNSNLEHRLGFAFMAIVKDIII